MDLSAVRFGAQLVDHQIEFVLRIVHFFGTAYAGIDT